MKKNNIFLIRNTINKNLLKKGYSMQASYFQTDRGYIYYIYTDLETKELVFLVIAENYTKDFAKGINPLFKCFERSVFSVARWYITTRIRKKVRWRIDFVEAYIRGGKIFIKKKKTIEELAEIAQNIISKYDIKPFNRKELYGNL